MKTNDIINADKLFGNAYKAAVICEYDRELELLKTIIESAEEGVLKKDARDNFTYEGICYKLAKTVIDYTKSAYDSLILGHFDTVYMLGRSILENRVFLELIHDDPMQELWNYYYVHSTWSLLRLAEKTKEKESLDFMNYLYSELNIEPEFYKKKSEKKPYINLNYGWAYKISDKLSAGALCDKCNRTLRGDFRTMSEYSHGTSIYLKVFDFTNHEHIMNMISFLYFRLFEVVNIYCLDTIGGDYNNARDELDEIFEQY